MLRGARAIAAHVPDYERWTRVLAQMDARRFYGPAGASSAPDLDRSFEDLAFGSEHPTWAVRGFPTYVLVDDQGVILARGNGIDGPFFLSRLDAAVEGIAP